MRKGSEVLWLFILTVMVKQTLDNPQELSPAAPERKGQRDNRFAGTIGSSIKFNLPSARHPASS
jgi:hypothetical protein